MEVFDPLRGYGRPTRFWAGTAARFFPPDEPLSAPVVAFLARMDELRFFMGRIYEDHHADAEHRLSAHDRRLQTVIGFRYSVIAIADAAKALDVINRDSRFHEALKGRPDLRRDFVTRRRAVKRTSRRWDFVRDKLAAHIDLKTVADTLRAHPESGIGGVWLGRKNIDFAFDIAHVVLAMALHKDAPPDDDQAREDALRAMTADASAATNDLLFLYPAVLWGFHQVTGGFFPR